MKGRIHSIESFGTVDGPGIRSVIFFQGCSLRCRYCHNPDTWDRTWGMEVQSEDIVEKVLRFKPFYGQQGGVTLSGGEPLLQPDFAASILKECKEKGLHTAVDTSGWVESSSLDKVLPYTDLLLLDVKAVNSAEYEWLTGKNDKKFRLALERIMKKRQELWLRYVVLPGVNDSPRHLDEFKKLLDDLGPCVKNVEFLPYHCLGIPKWEKLGLTYSLDQLKPPSLDQIEQMKKRIKDRIQDREVVI
jgi:pyruvate formate lyase activating enzyme